MLLGAIVVGVVGAAAVAVVGYRVWTERTVSTVGKVPFERPLAIPRLVDGEVSEGVRVFDLTADGARAELKPWV